MNRRQSLDKPAILSPPVQFIVPSPTASASPSPRLLQNCSPTAVNVLAHQQGGQQHTQHQQQRNLLSDVVLVTSPHGCAPDITARRLSTGSSHHHHLHHPSSAGASPTILLRQSPSQSPSHNIIFTNGPTATTSTGLGSGATTPTGHEFNTTLVGSNNIALNVKRGGTTIFNGPATNSSTSNLHLTNTILQTSFAGIGGGVGAPISNRRATISHAGGGPTTTVQYANHHSGGSGGGGGGGGSGGVSPRPGKRPITMTQSSPVPSPMASPTTMKQNTPNQSPIHHHQLPILTSHTSATGQPMYQLIQAGTQQFIQTTSGTVRQNMPATFHAPTTIIQQATQPPPPPLQPQVMMKNKAPQQILPKPATGIGTSNNNSSGGGGGAATSNSKSNSTVLGKHHQQQHHRNGLPQTTTTVTPPHVSNGPATNSNSNSSCLPLATSTSSTILTQATSTNPPLASNPILLPTTHQPQLIMSANQMPVLVQQNTPQGVQFILRQPTNQLTTAPLVLHHPGAAGARTQQLQSTGQPQQLLRIVNGNGQVQFSPATTTYIMSSQGNLIATTTGTPTTATAGGQLKGATEIQQKLNPIHLGQATTINGNLVQMSTGQFISQFPAQNFNFTNVNHQLVAAAAQNVAFATSAATGGSGGTGATESGGGSSADQSTIQFNSVMQPPLHQIHHQHHQQQQQHHHQQPQIISPIASPALQNVISSGGGGGGDLNDMVIVQQSGGVILGDQGSGKSKSGSARKVLPAGNVSSTGKAKREKKETKKEKAAKAAAAAVPTKKPPVVVQPPPPPPEPPQGKLDLARMCGIDLDDEDDDGEEMLLDTEYNPPPPPLLSEGEQMMEEQDEQQQQQHQSMEISESEMETSGNIMITIPGVNSTENIPISFTIPTSAAMGLSQEGDKQQQPQQQQSQIDEVITLDDDSWSPQKQQQMNHNNKPMDGTMCVSSFVNSVLSSQVTPTLQSQIAEIQNQLLGVTSSSSSPVVVPKTTTAVVPPQTKTVQSSSSPQAKAKKATSVTPKAKPSKKQNGAAAATGAGNNNNKKQSQAAAIKITKEAPKSIPTACGLVPSQIGNIQISQVDSSASVSPMSKVATNIENQIQITPILDTKQNAITTNFGNAAVVGSSSSNMTVTMKTVQVNSSSVQQQQQQHPQQMPKLQPTTMTPPQLISRPAMVQQQQQQHPQMQINLQAPPQANQIQIPMAVQQHPLLSQLTGALSLNLMDDGRLVLKHDANAPQDAQSQMILQTILSGALANLTLVNETSAPTVVRPPVVVPPVVEKPKLVPQKLPPQPVNQQQQQQQQTQRKAIVEPQQQQQQHVQPSQGNIVELPKIGADKQLFKMNMVTNQITQISAGSTTALVGPMEQLLIVPADINPQQLAQCQAAGQLQFNNMGQLKASAPQQQQQQQQQQLKPLPMMPALVSSSSAIAPKNVTTTTSTTSKKAKKVTKAIENVATAKGNPGRIVTSGGQVKQQQQQPVSSMAGGNKVVKPPILKSNATMMMSKINKGDTCNTAVVRPNTIQGGAGGAKPPQTITVPAANKITITPQGGQQQQQQTTIMQNLQKATQIVLPSGSAQSSQGIVQQQQQKQIQPQPQLVPRVQTIQLTPQNQQLLKDVQMKIQLLSGKLKDKNLLEKLTFPIELDESNPINRQPLPTLQNFHTMTDKDIHVALQRLFIEQQKILATGKVIPTISNYSQQQQQQQQIVQPTVSQSMNSNVMSVPPTVVQNKIQMPSDSVAGGGSSGNGAGMTAEMVKNWPLMKTHQFNEMTIKPIMTTSASMTSFPSLPNKVINSTTIIPAPVSGTFSMQSGGSVAAVAPAAAQMVGSSNNNNKKPGDVAAMSITPVVVSQQQQQQQHQQVQQQPQIKPTVMSGISKSGGSVLVNKPPVVTTSTIAAAAIPIGLMAGNVIKLEKVDPVVVKMEVVEEKEPTPKKPQGKSPQELAEITRRFEELVKRDQESCSRPDTDTPFQGKRDAVQRLFGYHCNYREHEPEYPEEEVRFQKAAISAQEGMWSLRQRYQGLLMNESMLHVATAERLMIERILVSEIRKEITDFQEDIERLKNPEPPPLVKLSPVTEQKPVESVVSPEVMPAPIMTNSGLSHEDDTTRTSDATDSRSMCDVKSESGQFGWNDWTEEEENSLSGARMISARGKKLVKVKDEEQEANTTNHHQPRTDGFDIESEILPNFILNMKVNNNNNNSATTSSEESVAKSKVEKKMRVASPVVKNEGYDEWSCIQKELASMTADHGLTTTTTTTTTSTSIKNELLLVKEPDLAERRFNELLSGGGEGGETKSKKSWMCSEQQLTTTTTTNRTSETCLSVHLDQAVGLGGSSSGTVPVSASVDQQQQHLHQTKQQTTTTTSNSSFFSCDPESWLDFQHNNNSFDFPMTANQGSAGTTTNHVDHHQQQQLTTNGHLDGSATTSSSTVTQKRPWNGILSGVNGDGGGVDDYYSKKMCYGNGDFDFNHLIMEGGANSQGSSLSNHCHDLQQSGSGGTGGGGGGGLGMDQQSHHNNHQHHIQSQQQQQQQQQSHHPTFDEDINRQVQSAIDSILNLQSSDAADFQFNLDPAMGALLGDSTTENVRGGGGGGSSLNFTNHHHLSGGGTGIGGGLIGNHHHHNHHHLDGLSSANSSPSPSMMNSRFAMEGQQQQQLNQQNHNSHHHHQHNQQHISSVLQHSRQNPSSQMSSTMILSDDDVDHDDEDEDDEQRQAIKSVLLS